MVEMGYGQALEEAAVDPRARRRAEIVERSKFVAGMKG